MVKDPKVITVNPEKDPMRVPDAIVIRENEDGNFLVSEFGYRKYRTEKIYTSQETFMDRINDVYKFPKVEEIKIPEPFYDSYPDKKDFKDLGMYIVSKRDAGILLKSDPKSLRFKLTMSRIRRRNKNLLKENLNREAKDLIMSIQDEDRTLAKGAITQAITEAKTLKQQKEKQKQENKQRQTDKRSKSVISELKGFVSPDKEY